MEPAPPTPPAPPGPGRRPAPQPPTIVEVDVVGLGPDEVEVRLADGRTGVVDRRDFTESTLPGTGDRIEAAVLARADRRGRVALSHAWARKHRGWSSVRTALEEGTTVTGTVRRAVKGGLVADVGGLRAFLPASLVDDEPVDPGSLVGRELELRVVEADQAADRLVVSHRDVVRRERRLREREALAALSPGRRVTGTVVELLDFGARVDLGGGVRGLVHRSELSWGRVGEVGDVVHPGQQVEVLVLDVQRSKRRVALSIRRLTEDPLASVEVGDTADAVITRVVDFGAFARLEGSGAEGLIHVSELTDRPGARPEELVVPGEQVRVQVIEVDRERHRLGLSVTRALLA